MSSLAGLLLFNKGEEGGDNEEQDGVVEGMGRESMRGSAVEELTLLLLLQKENTGEVGTATEQDMLMLAIVTMMMKLLLCSSICICVCFCLGNNERGRENGVFKGDNV